MSSTDTPEDLARAEQRRAALIRQAPLEFARVVYGINDRVAGRRQSMAAEDVARVEQQGVPVTRERAEQRARAYLPVIGHEHCPRCWVFMGTKNLLAFLEADGGASETAKCRVCGAEYASAVD